MEKTVIKIREMEPDDVKEVIKIEAAAYGDHHWSAEAFYNELSNNLAHYSCAVLDGKIVGYAGCWHILEEAHITNIAVSPEFQGNGIGEALLINLINDCYKNMIKFITLEVRASNISAIKMYEKYGFASLGCRKGYYQNDNEDALIMWTENIFWDKFKNKYSENVKKSAKKTEIL